MKRSETPDIIHAHTDRHRAEHDRSDHRDALSGHIVYQTLRMIIPIRMINGPDIHRSSNSIRILSKA